MNPLQKRKAVSKTWIWGILFGALLLRLPLLNGSFWLDEAAQALESTRPWYQQLDISADFQPPLLHVLLHVAQYFNQSEWWLRSIGALVPGLVSIYFAIRIAEHRQKPTTKLNQGMGWWTGILLATSSFHIFYSQELRPYALPTALVVLGWWWLLTQPNQTRKWFGYCLTTILGMYSSYLFPFALLGQLGWSWWTQPQTRRQLITTQVVAGLAFLPWLPWFWGQLQAGAQVRQQLPGWSAVVGIPQLKSLPLVAAKFIFGVLNVELNWQFGLVVGLLALSCCWLLIWAVKAKTSLAQWWRHPAVWWIVVPIVSSWVVSFWIPVLQPKRVLFALPGCYWVLAQIWNWTQDQSSKITKLTGWGLLLIVLSLNTFATIQYYTQPQLQRENWKELYVRLSSRYPQDSVALFSYPAPFSPWSWYQETQETSKTIATLSTGYLNINDLDSIRAWLEPATEYQFVIVFEYLSDLTDSERRLRSELEAYGYETIELIDWPVIGVARVYARPSDTIVML